MSEFDPCSPLVVSNGEWGMLLKRESDISHVNVTRGELGPGCPPPFPSPVQERTLMPPSGST